MKHRNKRVLMALYAAAGTLTLTGFTSLAAEPEYVVPLNGTAIQRTAEMSMAAPDETQEVQGAEIVPEWNFTEITDGVRADAVETVRTAAEKARAAYEAEQEAKRKAEEERKAAEEAARLEAERAAAEAAAQAQTQAAEQDKRLLAALIFCEAGNQPYEGQVAVGAVVMNRVNSGVYPNSISEVIYQSGQFTPAMTGWLDSVLAAGSYTDSAMQAAEDALAGSNPVGNCLYFSTGGYGMQIGDHYFH